MQPILGSEPAPFPDKALWAAWPFWLLTAPLLLLPLGASATLGEMSTTIEVDMASMKASTRMAPAPNYTVHAIRTPSGTAVREYVSAQGMVFAVAWQGPLLPDLRQTLGRYFDRYTDAAGAGRPGRRQVTVSESDLVVQSGGRMRSFSGRAYLPQLLPQGVTLEDLR